MPRALPALPVRAAALQEEVHGVDERELLVGRAAGARGRSELGAHGGLDPTGTQGRAGEVNRRKQSFQGLHTVYGPLSI